MKQFESPAMEFKMFAAADVLTASAEAPAEDGKVLSINTEPED